MSIISRYALTRGRLLILTLGLASALLIVAACGGPSNAATADTSPTSGPNGAPLSSPDTNLQPNAPGQPTGGIDSVPSEGSTLPQGVPGEVPTGLRASTSPIVQYNASQQLGIWVTGRGEVVTTPDLAILSAGVEARAETVAIARSQAAGAMSQILQILNAQGIESGDIQTRFFNISPEYVWNDRAKRQELVGYRVNNQVAVKIRDIDSAGTIIDAVAAAGGDLVRIQGVNFTVEDTEALEIQARKNAVENLMAKAQQFAELTDVQLGKPVFLSESGGFAPRITSAVAERAFDVAAAPSVQTPISGGELKVTITVQGTFPIVQ